MNIKLLLLIPITLAILLVSGCTTGEVTAPATGEVVAYTPGEVVVPGTATLYGKLADKATGMPVSGEPVRIGEVIDITDEQGNYEIPGIEPGTYAITWGGDEYYRIESLELLSEGQALERDIKLTEKRE